MSLRKRMFRWNMSILFSTLLALMAVILAVVILFEDSLESQIHAISQSRVEPNVEQVVQLVESDRNVQNIAQKAEQWNYRTALIRDGQVVSGDKGGQMSDLVEYFQEDAYRSGAVDTFVLQKATVVGRYLAEENAYLVVAHFPEEDWLSSSLNHSFYVFLAAVVLAGTGAIVFLLLLASFFTRRMNRVVMEPLEMLMAGAERIKSGNLSEKIEYQGEEEFEHVCQTFNDMQTTILEDQKQRARTEQARIDMVTGISHDLRTPLTSIQGYIKGILDGVADTESRKQVYLKTAYEATKEMNVLLQKLFEFSRVESGQMPFHMVKADLAEFTAAYVAQKEEVLDSAEVQFSLQMEKEWMPEISMDVEQIRRIFDNLLENSQKYAMVTPVQVELKIEETKNCVVLKWKDNGKGVAEDKIGRIFEKFYRCDESRKEKGSGVGLYVVKYIMERHGGEVRAENDGGLKICLYFPKEAV